jgi:hypothetical protein
MRAHFAKNLETRNNARRLCTTCGIALDSEYFDVSGVEEIVEEIQDAEDAEEEYEEEYKVKEVLTPGQEKVLASFELPAQYCGVLEYFSQFTDLHAKDPSEIRTPDIQWRILINRRPLYPYLTLDRIVNPWGYGSFPVSIRLDENAKVEFVVRRISKGSPPRIIRRIGGRIMGRYWYNAAYGDVV